MHGGGRNADDYRDAWVELAEDNNLLSEKKESEEKTGTFIKPYNKEEMS